MFTEIPWKQFIFFFVGVNCFIDRWPQNAKTTSYFFLGNRYYLLFHMLFPHTSYYSLTIHIMPILPIFEWSGYLRIVCVCVCGVRVLLKHQNSAACDIRQQNVLFLFSTQTPRKRFSNWDIFLQSNVDEDCFNELFNYDDNRNTSCSTYVHNSTFHLCFVVSVIQLSIYRASQNQWPYWNVQKPFIRIYSYPEKWTFISENDHQISSFLTVFEITKWKKLVLIIFRKYEVDIGKLFESNLWHTFPDKSLRHTALIAHLCHMND